MSEQRTAGPTASLSGTTARSLRSSWPWSKGSYSGDRDDCPITPKAPELEFAAGGVFQGGVAATLGPFFGRAVDLRSVEEGDDTGSIFVAFWLTKRLVSAPNANPTD
jgi:hypothetical protein